MISDRRRRGNRLVMSRRSGICCVNYRNRIRGWILVRRRLGKGKRGKGKGKGKVGVGVSGGEPFAKRKRTVKRNEKGKKGETGVRKGEDELRGGWGIYVLFFYVHIHKPHFTPRHSKI